MPNKELLKFIWKVLIALVVIFGLTELLAMFNIPFAGAARNFVTSPINTLKALGSGSQG